MHPILKNVIIELFVMGIVLILGCFFVPTEAKGLFGGGIAYFLSAVGVFWFIASFLRVRSGWGMALPSMFFAITLFLFGHTMEEYGLWHAIATFGVCCLAMCAVFCVIDANFALILFIISIIAFPVGYNLSSTDDPTLPYNHKPYRYEPITYDKCEWILIIDHQDKKTLEARKTTLGPFIGTEEFAYKYGRQQAENFINSSMWVSNVKIELKSAPKEIFKNWRTTDDIRFEYRTQYGYLYMDDFISP